MSNEQNNTSQIFGLCKFYGGTGDLNFYATLSAAVRAVGTDLVLIGNERACIRVFNMAESTGGPAYVEFIDHDEIVKLARMTDDQINELGLSHVPN